MIDRIHAVNDTPTLSATAAADLRGISHLLRRAGIAIGAKISAAALTEKLNASPLSVAERINLRRTLDRHGLVA